MCEAVQNGVDASSSGSRGQQYRRHINEAWRMEDGREGVAQVGEGEVVLMNMEFKEKCHTSGKYFFHKITNVSRRMNQMK